MAKRILPAALVASTFGVVIWVAVSIRGEPGSRTGSSKSAAASPLRRESRPALAPASRQASADPPLTAPVDGGTAVIRERIRKMEERLQELQGRKDQLVGSRQELENRIAEKAAGERVRFFAETRVKSWETPLALSESQKPGLVDLWARWRREDGQGKASREVWMARENELRSNLTPHQVAQLHQLTVWNATHYWSSMGAWIGGLVGLSPEEQTRLQKALGDAPLPVSQALLPWAHGIERRALLREAETRGRSLLTPEQAAQLDAHVPPP